MGFKKLFLSALLFTSFFNQTSQAHDTSSVEGLRDLCVYQQEYYAREWIPWIVARKLRGPNASPPDNYESREWFVNSPEYIEAVEKNQEAIKFCEETLKMNPNILLPIFEIAVITNNNSIERTSVREIVREIIGPSDNHYMFAMPGAGKIRCIYNLYVHGKYTSSPEWIASVCDDHEEAKLISRSTFGKCLRETRQEFPDLPFYPFIKNVCYNSKTARFDPETHTARTYAAYAASAITQGLINIPSYFDDNSGDAAESASQR